MIDQHLDNLSAGTILKGLNVFTNKFPELGILHIPAFQKDLQSNSQSTRTLLAAMLAVVKVQPVLVNQDWAVHLLSSEAYLDYTKAKLADEILRPPRIHTVQSLLIMTLHEWGSCGFHQAWIYCGIATRVMQAIHSQRVAPYPLEPTADGSKDAVSLAIENRAFWACFIMDRMISSGTYNPPMLPMSEMVKLKVMRPLSTVEFAFGPDANLITMGFERSTPLLDQQPEEPLIIAHGFEILVSGFDIWAQVMTFIFNDGRRAPGMCAPENCPWVSGSPWYRTQSQLRAWRAGQHHRLHYPSNSVAIHMSLGYGESFTYINLLYYVCTLMLHREYFPFLPTTVSAPRGPVDHPTLEAEAPLGWWEESARELFEAAERIADLLHEAGECGIALATPFVGFCAFSAAYMNLYIFRFPQMNIGRSIRADELMKMCLDYLEEFRGVWKLGDAWIKTLKYASLLYERAADDRGRYFGKTRDDFDILHQSIHEFRVLDRSDQHIQEIEGAEGRDDGRPVEPLNFEGDSMHLDMPLTDILTDLTNSACEQGAWSQWWPAEFGLILDQGGGGGGGGGDVDAATRQNNTSGVSDAGHQLPTVHPADAYND
ncbi:uncharacterized protein N7483_001171 [Penicillium malachiteum]|uniref:uncharacterized protein n=1 Tax=Penicillium malachiteum TaxID=1324776 RepID=UPI0025477914|nr:uncharacterized protein N7483_001171 [Penicillium malachiteum]KAJ5736046.1 hypothetical protein N7483_001171 [Penicillium malachiteum]